jgi:hypothetical protein
MTPRIKTVSVSYERKVNLGDFNSANVSCAVWADGLDLDGNLHQSMHQLWDMVKNNVKAQILPLTSKSDKTAAQMEALFLGLPVAEEGEPNEPN